MKSLTPFKLGGLNKVQEFSVKLRSLTDACNQLKNSENFKKVRAFLFSDKWKWVWWLYQKQDLLIEWPRVKKKKKEKKERRRLIKKF